MCVLLPICSLWPHFSLTYIVNLIPGVSRFPPWLSCVENPQSLELVFVGSLSSCSGVFAASQRNAKRLSRGWPFEIEPNPSDQVRLPVTVPITREQAVDGVSAEWSSAPCTVAEGKPMLHLGLLDRERAPDLPVAALQKYPPVPDPRKCPPTHPLLPSPPLSSGSPPARPQPPICIMRAPWVCHPPASPGLEYPSPSPPASSAWTPPQPVDPAAPPRLLAPLPPPSPVDPPAPPGSLIPPAPPWLGVDPPLPLEASPLAAPRRSVPPALLGSVPPVCSTWVLCCSTAEHSAPPWTPRLSTSGSFTTCSTAFSMPPGVGGHPSSMAPPSVGPTVGHHHGCGLGPAVHLLLSLPWLRHPCGLCFLAPLPGVQPPCGEGGVVQRSLQRERDSGDSGK